MKVKFYVLSALLLSSSSLFADSTDRIKLDMYADNVPDKFVDKQIEAYKQQIWAEQEASMQLASNSQYDAIEKAYQEALKASPHAKANVEIKQAIQPQACTDEKPKDKGQADDEEVNEPNMPLTEEDVDKQEAYFNVDKFKKDTQDVLDNVNKKVHNILNEFKSTPTKTPENIQESKEE